MIFRGSYKLTAADKALKDAIRERGQAEVAKAAGISQAALSLWVSGKRHLKEATARRVVEAVGMDWEAASKGARSGR